jgi:hypothetical protein
LGNYFSNLGDGCCRHRHPGSNDVVSPRAEEVINQDTSRLFPSQCNVQAACNSQSALVTGRAAVEIQRILSERYSLGLDRTVMTDKEPGSIHAIASPQRSGGALDRA